MKTFFVQKRPLSEMLRNYQTSVFYAGKDAVFICKIDTFQTKEKWPWQNDFSWCNIRTTLRKATKGKKLWGLFTESCRLRGRQQQNQRYNSSWSRRLKKQSANRLDRVLPLQRIMLLDMNWVGIAIPKRVVPRNNEFRLFYPKMFWKLAFWVEEFFYTANLQCKCNT